MKHVQAIIDSRGGLTALRQHPIRLENGPYMPLCIEYVGTGPRGLPMVSVAHYGEQNGDAMCDPDMVFEVGDTAFGPLAWGPISYRNDYLGADQTAVWTDDDTGRVFIKPRLVKELRAFARTWDRNIKEQGFA